MRIISYDGQTNHRQSNVVEFPALLKSGMKPVKFWVDNGFVRSVDENTGKTTYDQPPIAFKRVADTVKLFYNNLKEKPGDYQVAETVLFNFINDFRTKIFDVAMAQHGDDFMQFNKEYSQAKKEATKESMEQAYKEYESRPKLFVPKKS